jgi:2-dehydro-3-deoxyphosphooctonate aldolase (KDO 8-P synthase)
MQTVEISGLHVGAGLTHLIIAGPCVIEDPGLVMETAAELQRITRDLKLSFIFKSSYDKANRSSAASFRGPGLKKGLAILSDVKEKLGVPVLSDVHTSEEATAAGRVLDVLQIPAFLCRQTDLLVAAARTGRAVNVKKGQFLAPWDMANVVHKIEAAGSRRLLLTERGASFGYNNLVTDFRALPIMRRLGYPVIFDATHSVQLPGGAGDKSSGQREFVAPLARAAVAAGCEGLFMEVHPDPDKALSDGPNMVPLAEVRSLLEQVVRIASAVGPVPVGGELHVDS